MLNYKDFASMQDFFIVKKGRVKDAADECGVGEDTIIDWKKRLGIQPEHPREVVKRLIAGGKSVKEIQGEMGLTSHAVRYHIRKLGISSRPPFPEEELREAIANGMSYAEFAERMKLDRGTVARAAKVMGIAPPKKTIHIPDEKAEKVIAAYRDGKSVAAISVRMRIPEHHIYHMFRKRGIKARSYEDRRSVSDIKVAMMREAGHSITEIMKQFGVSRITVHRSLHRSGIQTAPLISVFPELKNPEWLRERYEHYRSGLKIADELGCYPGSVYAAFIHFSLPLGGSHIPELNNPEWLRQQYAEKSVESIGDMVGCTGGTVRLFMRKYGIEIRSKDEQIALRERTVAAGAGKISSTEARSKVSTESFSKSGPMIFHSDLEKEIAKQINRDESVLSFRRGHRVTTPDFSGNLARYTPDFAVQYDGHEKIVEVKPNDVMSRQPQNSAREYHQFCVGVRAFGDKYEVWEKSRRHLGTDLVNGISDEHRYYALNYPDWFASAGDLADFLKQMGWLGYRHSTLGMYENLRGFRDTRIAHLNGIISNKIPSAVGNVIFNFHGDALFRSRYKDCSAPADMFHNREALRVAASRFYHRDGAKRSHYVGLLHLLKGLKPLGAPIVSQFKPAIAAALINRYARCAKPRVFDPCAGWGARMLGAMRCGGSYVGLDFNTQSVRGNREMADFMGYGATLVEQDCRQPWPEEEFDLLITSPPYDRTEMYYGLPDWYSASTKEIVGSIFEQSTKRLSEKGAIVLNIPKLAEEETLRLGADFGFSVTAMHVLRSTRVLVNMPNDETIIVFTRAKCSTKPASSSR